MSELQIGVIGSGSMGTGIAQVAATAGHQVIISDQSVEALEKAKNKLEKIHIHLVEKGKISIEKKQAILNNISYTQSLADFKDCGLVIEAIVENIEVKKAVFQEVESIVSENTIIGSNTSSLSIAAIAAACKNPERVIGIHFFNPAFLMPLVEITPAIQTSEDTKNKIFQLMNDWQKAPVIAKDTPGFIVNRVARPFYGEALRIYEEGIADFATIDYAMREKGHFRMGPFQLMDFIGNDVNFTVTETVFKSFYYDPRYKPSFTQKRLSEAGWLGRKTGKGYYDYAENATIPEPNKDEDLLHNILERIVVMLINEAADALYLNIASKEDIDLAMTKGVNYPKGLLAWADEWGTEKCVSLLDNLYNEYHEDRYRCSPLLRRMAKKNTAFY